MYVRKYVCMYVLLPSKDRSALTEALNSPEVRGTSISFSPLIWADSPLWHEARINDKTTMRDRFPWDEERGLILPLACVSHTICGHFGA
jgi:hypothetical protein